LSSCKPWVTSCNLVTELLNKTWNLILPPKLFLYQYSLPYVNITRKIRRFDSKDLDSTSWRFEKIWIQYFWDSTQPYFKVAPFIIFGKADWHKTSSTMWPLILCKNNPPPKKGKICNLFKKNQIILQIFLSKPAIM